MATYENTKTNRILNGFLIGFFTLGLAHSLLGGIGGEAYLEEPVFSDVHSGRMTLLSPNFTTKIPDPVGGPSPIYIEDSSLVSQITVAPNGVTVPVIQDTNGVSLYIVQKGDTLSEIAELFDVTVNTIKWENNLGKTLKVGKELKILPVTGVSHTIKKGDTYGKIAKTYDVEIEDITVFNNLSADKLKIGQKIIVPNGVKKTYVKSTPVRSSSSTKPTKAITNRAQNGYYIRPVANRSSSLFGPRSGRYHYGIDYATPIGTPVAASASGTVSRTYCGSGYGVCLVVKHNNGTQTLYAHNSRLFVKVGDRVRQGQKIANSGNTGRSTGPHLHFEIQNTQTGAKVNPNFLK